MSKPAPIRESFIQSAILEWLRLQSWCLPIRMHVGPIPQQRKGARVFTKNPLKGIPDILGWLRDGRGFAIEVKSATGRLAPEQRAWAEQFKAFNVIWCEARSLDDVQNFFAKELGAG